MTQPVISQSVTAATPAVSPSTREPQLSGPLDAAYTALLALPAHADARDVHAAITAAISPLTAVPGPATADVRAEPPILAVVRLGSGRLVQRGVSTHATRWEALDVDVHKPRLTWPQVCMLGPIEILAHPGAVETPAQAVADA